MDNRMTPMDIVAAMKQVHEHFPSAFAVTDRANHIDFYRVIHTRVPVAVLDLRDGGLTIADDDNGYTMTFPVAGDL